MERFYITTPIYYANGEPHLGHAYTTTVADVLARYHRLMGHDVLYLTGMDEHGQKVELAAKERDASPQDFVDEMAHAFEALWDRLNISHDDFIRTTEARHKNVVTEALQRVYDAGEIYSADYEGWYSVYEEQFFTEKDLVDGKDPIGGREVAQLSEKNYFFKMSAYQDWLIEYIETHPDFIRPATRRNEILGFLRQPLGDLCISRPKSRVAWGIPLPFDADYVTYVWFDALLNYVTATGYLVDDAAHRRWWPASCHLIGKDILTTHCVYWPTMLKAMGLPIPETIMAHGYWLVDAEKMGKSRGNAVEPLDLVDSYGVDAFRYYLVREMTVGQDSNFTVDSFVARYNAELANDLGNLVNRSVVMADRYLDGCIPEVDPSHTDIDLLRRQAAETAVAIKQALPSLNTVSIVEAILSLVREANRFIEVKEPWALARDVGRKDELDRVIYGLAETLRQLAAWLSPIMPEKAQAVWEQIGCEGAVADVRVDALAWGGLASGQTVKKMAPLFPKVDLKEAAIESDQTEEEDMAEEGDTISFSDFQKIDLRVAIITAAEKVEGADRLLKVQIDLGAEERQLVAGVAQHYEAEALVGRRIVVVANLEPATIRGVESQGMLLAASADGQLGLLTPDSDLPAGARVS